MKNRPFGKRVAFAWTGVREGWRRERSFRTHVIIAVLAVIALIVLHPTPIWWAIVVLVAVLVLALELFNSALECLIDHLHPDVHPEIRIVKDMAAGAVLLLSGAAIVIAMALVIATL